MATIVYVDPRILRLPGERRTGADPVKLARQTAAFGCSMKGMPPIEVTEGADGLMQILDGATRATRIAKLGPGQAVPVLITERQPKKDFSRLATIGETLP